MVRELIKEKIKQLITILKKEPANWSDLKRATGLPDKTLGRYLDYVEYWGLAKKNDLGWRWFENFRTCETEHDYQLAMNHSRKLLDTLAGFFQVSINKPEWYKDRGTLPGKMKEKLLLCDMAREHLKTGYPKLYAEIVAFEKLIEQRNELAESFGVYKPKIDQDKLIEYIGNFTLLKQYIIPKEHRKEVEQLVTIIGPERLALIERTDKNYTESLIKISNELRRLVLMVEHGEPLEGNCQFCPKIKINQINQE
jgi:hypothetical protein